MLSTMTNSVPIIFVHGNSPTFPAYAVISLIQARRINLETQLYVISETEPLTEDGEPHTEDGVSYITYSHFAETVNWFRDAYFHISRQPFDVERICIERWFLIRDLMRERGIRRCFCMDSDVLLFNTVSSIAQRFAGVDYTILNGMSWGTTFINKLEVLEDFCGYVSRVYDRDPEIWAEVDQLIGFSRPFSRWENINDMTLVFLFSKHFKEVYSVAEQAQVVDGAIIDPNFNISDPGLEMDGQFKKVHWINGFPFGTLSSSGEPVRFDLIHFQGVHAKGLMKEYFHRFTPTWEKLTGRVFPEVKV